MLLELVIRPPPGFVSLGAVYAGVHAGNVYVGSTGFERSCVAVTSAQELIASILPYVHQKQLNSIPWPYPRLSSTIPPPRTTKRTTQTTSTTNRVENE